MLDALRMSVGTVTAIPVRAPTTINQRVAGQAMLLAPVAALPIAALACLVVLAGELSGVHPLATAATALGTVALASRGLHIDGLADTADGLSRVARSGALGRSDDRARALTVMRQGDVGPMGVAAVLFVVLVQVGALTGAIVAGHGVFAMAVAVLASRLVLAGCCAAGVPAARDDGLGATVAGSVPRWQAVATLAAGIAVAAAAASLVALSWWHAGLAVLVAFGCAGAVLARCVRRLGGVTGDVLGACVEAAVLGALIVLAT